MNKFDAAARNFAMLMQRQGVPEVQQKQFANRLSKHAGSSGGCAECAAGSELETLRGEIQQLRRELGGGSGGTYSPGNADRYTTGSHSGNEPGHGGVIRYDDATFGVGDPAGTTEVVTPASEALEARQDGQKLCSIFCIIDDALADDLGNIEMSLRINDDSVSQARNIPLLMIADDANGSPNRWSFGGIIVPRNDVVQVVYEATSPVETQADNAVIKTFMETGENCG